MQVRKQQNWTWKNKHSKLGKEYDKALYGQPAYLTSMQSTSWAGLDESQDGIKIIGRNISNGYADDTTLMAEVKRN